MTQVAATHRMIFDIHDDDVYWCAADIGWVTGHSYIVYGPLANHTTGDHLRGRARLARQGPPVVDRREVPRHHPLHGADRHPRVHAVGDGVPRASTTCPRCGCWARSGEPINPEAWVWYWKYIGGERCPVVDTWWQTETGAILITPLPGFTPLKPGSATYPFPGIEADIVDEAGNSVPLGGGGYLVLRHPWPAISRTIWGDPDRYVETYFGRSTGPDSTWRATAPSATTRATTGCSDGSTT